MHSGKVPLESSIPLYPTGISSIEADHMPVAECSSFNSLELLLELMTGQLGVGELTFQPK